MSLNNENNEENSQAQGVGPTLHTALDPRQKKFIELYLTTTSLSFGNCYQSAIAAGYTHETARNLTHNRPKWLSEKLGQIPVLEPQFLLAKLMEIINDPKIVTRDKLKALDMMMKHHAMYKNENTAGSFRLNIQNVLQ